MDADLKSRDNDDREDLQEPGATKRMIGGGGNQGFNALGLPYATNAIGSGPDVSARDTNKARKGISFESNSRREPDRDDDRLQNRR